jgi:hypothetical protein
MSRTGRRAVRAATPIAQLLDPVTRRLPAIVSQARALTASMRTNGVVEGLQGFVYYAALATSRFDRYSHILPSYQVGVTCNVPATLGPTPGCDGHFAGSTSNPGRVNDKKKARKGRASRKTEDRRQKTERRRSRGGSQRGRRSRGGRRGDGRSAPARPPQTPPRGPVPTPQPPQAPAPPPTPLDPLLDFLLGP